MSRWGTLVVDEVPLPVCDVYVAEGQIVLDVARFVDGDLARRKWLDPAAERTWFAPDGSVLFHGRGKSLPRRRLRLREGDRIVVTERLTIDTFNGQLQTMVTL